MVVLEHQVAFIYNVLLNTSNRLENLYESVSLVADLPNITFNIRLRGLFASNAADGIAELLRGRKVVLHIGDEGLTWAEATLRQVTEQREPYFALLQEDHLLVNRDLLVKLLLEIQSHPLDYLPLSFFPQSQEAHALVGSKYRKKSTSQLDSYFFPERPVGVLRGYFSISMVGLFSRSFIMKFLTAPLRFPIFYSHRTPFVLERKFSDPAVYPLTYGWPKSEIFACLDDDCGIPGYSLMSRIGQTPQKREIQHRGKILDSLSSFMTVIYAAIGPKWSRKLQVVAGLPIWLSYYLEYLLNRRQLEDSSRGQLD